MSVDLVRVQQLFGSECVTGWDPPDPALHGFLPAETPVVAPHEIAEFQEVMRFASREKHRVLPAGSMEHLYLGAPPDGVELVLTTRRMARVLEYEPSDQTLVAQAGTTLHEIAARAGEFGQHLAPDPWPGRAATLGGACAANRFGLTRLRHGTWRDCVLGARVVHADGSTTRSGGKVVKNVTGYDLAKLYLGSLGSLVFLVEVNVRLAQRPQEVGYVVARLAPAVAQQRLLELHRGWLQPAALLLLSASAPEFDSAAFAQARHDAGELLLFARFEGQRAVVREQLEECAQQLDGAEVAPDVAASEWERLRRLPEPEPHLHVLRVSTRAVGVFDALVAAREVFGAQATTLALFGVGTSFVRLAAVESEALAAFRERLQRTGAQVTLQYAPADGARRLDPPPAQAASLQAAMKSLFDPGALLRPMPSVAIGAGARAEEATEERIHRE
ncbi:MAG: FAD-binding oxidoreductase [Candidatus Latescibacterota bacterium]|nr:MAG: FAD-binding oxidoreductase [Candidatus Latescibacterota bacterium]